MASSKFKRGGNAVIYAMLTIGIMVLINIIGSRIFVRGDLTEDKIYTISKASKQLVAALPDRLTIKAFISSDLPPQVRTISRYLRDMLDEYATASKGKVLWEAIDPSQDEAAKSEATRLKVMPARLSVYEKSKASVSESYMGVAFQFGGKVESLPFVSDISNLEYQISSTIRKLTSKKKKVGITSGHGEPSLGQGLANAQQALAEYEISTVDLTEGKNPIPADIDLLLVIGPTQPFAERAKYELDQFLMKGKPLALLLNGMVIETPKGQFMPNQAPPRIGRANAIGLGEQLAHYGVKVHEDIVMDQQNARVILPTSDGRQVITNYPGFPVVTGLSKESAMTSKLKAFIPIFASSLEQVGPAKDKKSGLKVLPLATSSAASWRQTGFFVFDPLQPPQPGKDLGSFDLAYYIEGSFKSFFAGKPIPAPGPATTPAPGAASAPDSKSTTSGQAPQSASTARLVVFGDADFVNDQYLGIYPGNLMLFQNMVDFLAEDTSLIAIRAKTQTQRPLERVEDNTITLVKLLNVVVLPLAFIGFGVVRWRFRRVLRRRRADEIVQLPPRRSEPARTEGGMVS